MYAILDIETTGGKYNQEGITEIAIYRYDGHKIVDQFISLINPERAIQPFVVNLTGISNEMLRNAPKFYEVAKRIIEITENAFVVAHNVSFDYRILCTEFDRLGYQYQRETLCTVELSKKIIPDLKSYSLGKLVRELGIPITDRHRASGDAKATVTLFKLLLSKDTKKEILTSSVRTKPKKQLDVKLLEIMQDIPNETGIYYMHKEDGSIIYIGKSKNLKKRILQHFTSENRKSKKIQEEVVAISYEKTGSELIALLKENEEIKINKPIYNRSLTRSSFQWQLTSFKDENGYLNLKIEKTDSRKKSITKFTNQIQARNFLFKITSHYNLCQKLTGISPSPSACFSYTIKQCEGACIQLENLESYNERVEHFIENNTFHNKSLLIIDKGKDIDNHSVIYIEEGKLIGIAFFELNYQINNIEVLKSLLTPLSDNRDAQYIIQNAIRKNKNIKTKYL